MDALFMLMRLWAKIDQRGPDECWPWLGKRLRRRGGLSYGFFYIKLKARYAHRVVFEIETGVKAEMVLHTCDNSGCVNPRHLYAGNVWDNAWDAIRNGRCGRAKLTRDEVQRIRKALRRGETLGRIASRHRVRPRAIQLIRDGLTWSALPEDTRAA